jgi:hypothetical protein
MELLVTPVSASAVAGRVLPTASLVALDEVGTVP